ncbi:MAG: hypothetical protein LAT68_03840 [Cyclobacteriaceae bacterium]|nr:hypothetical protein [Cyclobacteriaceae bacterium]
MKVMNPAYLPQLDNQLEIKAFLLLKAVVLSYHGLDKAEKELLYDTAESLNARAELDWAFYFINTDLDDFYERACDFFQKVISPMPNEKKLDFLKTVWRANDAKGYITEMEATAMIRIAAKIDIEDEFMGMIRNG